MALSNKFGWLVLTTGNKSEISVGYSTLYGDTAGGFAVIKDVPKTLVYRLVRLPQRRDGGTRSRLDPRRARRAPSCAPTRRTRTRCPTTTSSTRSSRPTSSRTPAASSSIAPGCPTRVDRPHHRASSTAPSTSAASAAGRSRSRRARSAATGGCRSRTATAARIGARRARARRSSSGTRAHRRPSSSVMSTSQTQVVRPRWRRRARRRGSCRR